MENGSVFLEYPVWYVVHPLITSTCTLAVHREVRAGGVFNIICQNIMETVLYGIYPKITTWSPIISILIVLYIKAVLIFVHNTLVSSYTIV